MTHDELVAYCLAKPGAEPDEPWEGDLVAKVGGKVFAFLGSGTGVSLKCGRDADEAAELRDAYPDSVTQSAYIGRYGWNRDHPRRCGARRRAARAGRRVLRRRGRQAAAPAATHLM